MLQSTQSVTRPSPFTICMAFWSTSIFFPLAIFLLSLLSCEFLGRMVHSCINWRKRDQEFKVLFDYLLSLKSAWGHNTLPQRTKQNNKKQYLPAAQLLRLPRIHWTMHLFAPVQTSVSDSLLWILATSSVFPPQSELSLEALDGCAGAEGKQGCVEPRLRSNRAETYRGRGHGGFTPCSPEG